MTIFCHINFSFDLFDLFKLIWDYSIGTNSAVKNVLHLRREWVNLLLASLSRDVLPTVHLYWVNLRFLNRTGVAWFSQISFLANLLSLIELWPGSFPAWWFREILVTNTSACLSDFVRSRSFPIGGRSTPRAWASRFLLINIIQANLAHSHLCVCARSDAPGSLRCWSFAIK